MTKRKRVRRTRSQQILWVMSLLIVGSMVVSLVIVALQPATPAPTPFPTFTPPPPSATPLPTFAPFPTATLEPLPTLSPTAQPTAGETEPVIGPAPATATPTIALTLSPTAISSPEPTLGVTATATATPPYTSTPSSADVRFTFAVAGDSRGNRNVFDRVLEAVVDDGSEFLIHTGDLVNKGTERRWRLFQESMAFFPLPFFPVPGNHDGLRGELDHYPIYSGAPAEHYSFDWGSAHFTLADSHDGGLDDEEMAWLRDDLSSTKQPLKIVVLHHPPFDPDGTRHTMVYGRRDFLELVADQDVDYVFAGHIHAFVHGQRNGVEYYITGGAGAALYSDEHPEAFYHYLHVTVAGEELTVEVVRI